MSAKMEMKDARSFLQEIQSKKSSAEGTKIDSSLTRKNVLDLKILICIDVSGSISPAQFKQFMNQVDAIKGLSVVKILEVDDQVVAVYDYFKTKSGKIARLRGGGGTAFHSAFEMAKEMNPDAILFMTDGLVADSVRDPNIPTGWVLTKGGVHPYGFGKVVLELPSVY